MPDETSIILLGEIAHIHAISSDGPRGKLIPEPADLNHYANLILLCANCHSRIDQHIEAYTADELRTIKHAHERSVAGSSEPMDIHQAKNTLDQYADDLGYLHHKAVAARIATECIIQRQSPAVLDDALAKLDHQDTIITGRSGCGKSLLARQRILEALHCDEIPVFMEAVQFTADLDGAVNRSLQVFGLTLHDVTVVADLLHRKILLIIDGYNECPPALQPNLNLWILRFKKQHKARVLLTTQSTVDQLNELAPVIVEIQEPNLEIKTAMARAVCGPGNEHRIAQAKHLLEAVKTGLEACLIGQVVQHVKVDGGRFAVFDAYARQCLGTHADAGIAALSLIAKDLYERITFSMSVTQLSRLLSTMGVQQVSSEVLFHTGLLVRYGDRVAFSHELFFNAFSAEAIVRDAKHSAEKISQALQEPRHNDKKSLVIGAMQDLETLDAVLNTLDKAELLSDLAQGHAGEYPKTWIAKKFHALLDRMDHEADSISFYLTDKGDGWLEAPGKVAVVLDEASLTSWSSQEEALIVALPAVRTEIDWMKRVFACLQRADQRLLSEFNRLLPEARAANISIRTTMFQKVYYPMSHGGVAIGRLVAFFSGICWNEAERSASQTLQHHVIQLLQTTLPTNGQVLLITALDRYFHWREATWRNARFSLLSRLIQEKWKFLPYHVQIAVLDALHWNFDWLEEQRLALIDLINNIPQESTLNAFISTAIVDALQGLGALEQDEHAYVETVRREYAEVIETKEPDEKSAAAFAFYVRSFDHPFYVAYWEVINSLKHHEQKHLYELALQGASTADSFGVATLLSTVARYDDPTQANLILRLATFPNLQSIMPQDAAEVYLLAHIVLGVWNTPRMSWLPHFDDQKMKACAAYAEIMYWANRNDVTPEVARLNMQNAWDVLLDHQHGMAASVIRYFQTVTGESIRLYAEGRRVVSSLRAVDEENVKSIFREAILRRNIQQDVGQFEDRDRIVRYAIQVLGSLGGWEEILILKPLVPDPVLGADALQAIASMEKRSVRPA